MTEIANLSSIKPEQLQALVQAVTVAMAKDTRQAVEDTIQRALRAYDASIAERVAALGTQPKPLE